MTRFNFASAGKGAGWLWAAEVLLLAAIYLLVVELVFGDFATTFVAEPVSETASLRWTELVLFLVSNLVCLFATGLYNPRLRCDTNGIIQRFIISLLLSIILLYILKLLVVGVFPHLPIVVLALLASYLCLCLFRYLLAVALDGHFKYRVLVLGTGEQASIISRRMRRHADRKAFVLVGYIKMDDQEGAPQVPEDQIIHLDGPLEQFVEQQRIDEVVVACDERRKRLPVERLFECRLRGVRVVDILGFIERETGQVAVNLMYPSWLVYSDGFRRPNTIKGMIDYSVNFVIGVLLLTLCLPLMVITALAIVLEGGGPVLFHQIRVGQGGKRFYIIKFRSMRQDSESQGAKWAGVNDDRTTRVGRVIRKYHIDELPQIFNVLKGEMSFIGPRPEQPVFVDKLAEAIPYYNERHHVKPGLTGWAQLRYPYGASENDALEKLKYDLYYIKNKSVLFDLLIFIQTIEVVLFAKGSR